MIRTRLAASPTGYPHIGTIYQALFDYAIAKKNKGRFLVRIEDTDRKRFVEGSEDVISESLDWFGLIEDESPRKSGKFAPYRQSERLDIYHKYAQILLDQDNAYFDYLKKNESGMKKDYSGKDTSEIRVVDTIQSPPKNITEMLARDDWVLRMKVPRDSKIKIKDEIRGIIEFDSDQVTEQVLLKSDGFPTYHLASVVDDYLMEITHVMRAEEWLSSTPKHFLLYEYFGWEKPLFFHTPILRNPDKSKLSKRQGHTDIRWYRDEGYLADAILNFLALLGWTHPQEKELFDLDEFVSLFDPNDIRTVAPIFDLTKLRWMNQQYIQMSSDKKLKKLILEFAPFASELPDKSLERLIPLLRSRMETLSDFVSLTGMFFNKFGLAVIDDNERVIANILKLNLTGLNQWKHDKIFEIMKSLMVDKKVKMPVMYKILTGSEKGLPLPESIEILGKQNTLKRLEEVLND